MTQPLPAPARLTPVFDARLPPGVHACMSTREGGHSHVPWDSFNLGDHVGDASGHVLANRQQLADALGARPVFLRQVHGTEVLELHADTPDGAQADACFTLAPRLACTIMVADCLPVLLWDTQGRWVAAAHAGWRGLAGQGGLGVLESLWAALLARGARAEDTRGWLGPCIGPRAFEVGPDVLQAFEQPGTPRALLAQAFRPAGASGVGGAGLAGDAPRWLADLPALARWRLAQLGVLQIAGNDGSLPWCTVSQPGRFFSHRRDAVRLGSTGRMAACIWRG